MYPHQQAGWPNPYMPSGYPPGPQPYAYDGSGQGYVSYDNVHAPQQYQYPAVHAPQQYHPGHGAPAPYYQHGAPPGPSNGYPPPAWPSHPPAPHLPEWRDQHTAAAPTNKRARPSDEYQPPGTSTPSTTVPRQQQHSHQQRQQSPDTPLGPPKPAAASASYVPPTGQEAAWYQQLSRETTALAAALRPTTAEQAQRKAMLEALRRCVLAALGELRSSIQCHCFGSFASGLSLHSSDLDVALTGVFRPDGPKGGFLESTKLRVAGLLRRVERQALEEGSGLKVASVRLVPKARIPVLKLQLTLPLDLDISFNDTAGQAAAQFVDSWCARLPYLADMVLLFKVVLRQRSLHEVFNGGLGSWSLTNMVIAHLLEAERQCGGDWAQLSLGQAVEGFLRRYGADFDYDAQAVSVKAGGFVARGAVIQRLEAMGITDPQGWRQTLILEDPLSGREVAGGSHCMADVRLLFRRLADRLQQDRQYAATDTGAAALQAARAEHAARMAAAGGQQRVAGDIVRVLGTDYEVLPMLLDVAKSVERAGPLPQQAQRGQRPPHHTYGAGRR